MNPGTLATEASPDEGRDEGFIFQVELEIQSDTSFIARPNLRSLESNDWEERVADLQYRYAPEFSVGHSVSTESVVEDGQCRKVRTCWLPTAEAEKVAPSKIPGVTLGMELLALLHDGADAQKQLGGLVISYKELIKKQAGSLSGLFKHRKETAEVLLHRANLAAERIQASIDLLAKDFRIIEESHDKNTLNLVVVIGYLKRLLDNCADRAVSVTKSPRADHRVSENHRNSDAAGSRNLSGFGVGTIGDNVFQWRRVISYCSNLKLNLGWEHQVSDLRNGLRVGTVSPRLFDNVRIPTQGSIADFRVDSPHFRIPFGMTFVGSLSSNIESEIQRSAVFAIPHPHCGSRKCL